MACLEMCEREAFGGFGSGRRRGECLGVAFRSGDGEGDGDGDGGECRFWGGERGRHDFLPVGGLSGGIGGRWQVLYM